MFIVPMATMKLSCMNIIFTICSNNYLAKAKVLGISVKEHVPGCLFFIFLCDRKIKEIDYEVLADEVIAIEEVEPLLDTLAEKYNLVELNTCIKPTLFQYLFLQRKAAKVIFLDPDVKLYNNFDALFESLGVFAVLLTPHICTPIAIDGKKPAESMFNNFGIYNLGFIGLSNTEETFKLLQWWKEHTYKQGYIDVYNGMFVDQLPINHAPVFFKDVKVLSDMGVNMAPWNLHERFLQTTPDGLSVNGKFKLSFYHFSSFKPGNMELPQQYYNRFRLQDRADLKEIYQQYGEDLQLARNDFFEQFICSYTAIREAAIKKNKKAKLLRKIKKLFGGNK